MSTEIKHYEDLNDKMHKDLIKIGLMREKEEKLRTAYNKIKQMFEESNEALITNLHNTQAKLGELESGLRETAVEYYGHTGTKKMVGGIGIKVMTKLDYNPDKAFEWAKEHGLALQLDKRSFETIAKTQEIKIGDEVLVRKREVPTATLPSNIDTTEGGTE
jgi:hypothetical protein